MFDVQSPDEHLEALISQAQYGSCKATQSTQVIARSHLKKIIFGYCISKNHFGFITSDLRSLIGNFELTVDIPQSGNLAISATMILHEINFS